MLAGDARATVLIYVRHDCPIANRYAPTIEALTKHYRPRGVEFRLIYLDDDETPELIARHQLEYSLSASALRDPAHRSVSRTGVRVTPQAVLVDADGRIQYSGRIDDAVADFGRYRARPTRADLRLAIDALLAGRNIEVRQTKAIGCYIPASPTPASAPTQ